MIFAAIVDDLIAGPFEVEDGRFLALSEADRNRYGFWPCEVCHHKPDGSNLGPLYPLSRRTDRVRAHYRQDDPDEYPELAQATAEMLDALLYFDGLFSHDLSTHSDIFVALEAAQNHIIWLVEEFATINAQPDPEVE